MKDMTKNLISVMATLLLIAISLNAQSTNPSSPTPLSGTYTGKGPSQEKNYYFNFTAGPGNVSVRLDIKAKEYSTFARIEIGNDPSNLIAMHNMNASTTTGPASVTKQFKLAEEQTVRIKLTFDGNLAEYTLSVNGAGSEGSGKTGSSGKIGKLTTGSGSKLGAIGSTGKQKTGTLGSTGGGQELTVTCPAEIEYQIIPVADWNAGLYGKKRLKFDSVAAEGATIFCTYSVNSGVATDSSTLTKKVPVGYVCAVYKGGPGNRIVTCTQAPTASVVTQKVESEIVASR